MNDHESIRTNVVLAASAALSQEEFLEVRRHLKECAECSREYELWGGYSRGLRQLPQPAIPPDLVARTQARILSKRAEASNERWNAGLLVGLTVFSWVISFSMWAVARALSGGAVEFFGVNLLNTVPWFLTSFVLTGVTGGVAALMLDSHREMRRVL
jgi:anti-sigma factor RsiW